MNRVSKYHFEFNNKCNISTSNIDLYSLFLRLFNFRDVENIVPIFTGEKHETVYSWTDKFESFSCFINLSEIQKLIFDERVIGGIASLFVISEKSLTYQRKTIFF